MDPDINPVDEILLPHPRVAERAIGKFRPKMRFKTEVSIPTTLEPPNLNVTQESVNQLENSHSQDQGEPGEVGDTYNMEALDFAQPPLNKVVTVGKFQPKTRAQPKGKMLPTTSEAILHDDVSRDQTQVYDRHTNSPIGFDKLESEATTVLSGLEYFDDGLFQSSATAENASFGGFAAADPDYSLVNSSATWESTDLVREQEDQVETCTPDVVSLECIDLPLGRANCIVGYTKSSMASKDTSGEAQSLDVESTPHIMDGRSIPGPVNDATCKSSRKLRKRTDVFSPAANDKINDIVSEFDKSISETYEECSHEVYTGEERPKQKREPRKCKSHKTDIEKPVRKRKKALEEPSTTNQESIKKKFPHRTRRKRHVNKVLLETPEEEIDRKQLILKDLIMLGEAKERISNKAAAVKKSNPHESAENHFDDEHRNFYGDEADPRIEESSTRLNYHSFMNRRTWRWSKCETGSFYEAMRQFGTDFAMIQKLFPGLTRHQIKLKFKNEERKHPFQVGDALAHRSRDHSHFKLLIQKLREESEQQNAHTEETYDPAEDALQDASAENEEEIMHDGKVEAEAVEAGDWDCGAAKSDELEGEALNPAKFDDYDGDYYECEADFSSPRGLDKDTYNDY